jgi:cell wall-associated NlpC family hydrolase
LPLLQHRLIHPLRRAVQCALLIGAGLSSGGTIALAAMPTTARTHLTPTKPKPRKRATTSRTSEAKRKAVKSAADTAPDLPSVPALLQLVVSPTGELTIQGGATAEQTFGAVPLVGEPTEDGDAKPLSGFSASAERLLSAMMDRARSQLGTRYVLGGNAPGQGLDCSSFARFAMEALGIRLPRTAAQQARVGTAVPRDRKMLRPGDLLTFGRGTRVSHVGIYLGEGRFIHASVASGQIIETTIERNTRLFRRWQGARRLIAGADSGETAGAF